MRAGLLRAVAVAAPRRSAPSLAATPDAKPSPAALVTRVGPSALAHVLAGLPRKGASETNVVPAAASSNAASPAPEAEPDIDAPVVLIEPWRERAPVRARVESFHRVQAGDVTGAVPSLLEGRGWRVVEEHCLGVGTRAIVLRVHKRGGRLAGSIAFDDGRPLPIGAGSAKLLERRVATLYRQLDANERERRPRGER